MRTLGVALGLGRFSKILRGSLRSLRWRWPQGSESLGGWRLGNSNRRFSSARCALLVRYLSREGNGRENSHIQSTVVTYVAGDHDSKNHEITGGDFGAPHCSCSCSCSCSYSCSCSCSYSCSYSCSCSLRSSIAIQPIGPQVTANRFDQRSASLQFQQPMRGANGFPRSVSLASHRKTGVVQPGFFVDDEGTAGCKVLGDHLKGREFFASNGGN